MMGQHDRSESLFYYFRLEDQVPENHLLRGKITPEVTPKLKVLTDATERARDLIVQTLAQ